MPNKTILIAGVTLLLYKAQVSHAQSAPLSYDVNQIYKDPNLPGPSAIIYMQPIGVSDPDPVELSWNSERLDDYPAVRINVRKNNVFHGNCEYLGMMPTQMIDGKVTVANSYLHSGNAFYRLSEGNIYLVKKEDIPPIDKLANNQKAREHYDLTHTAPSPAYIGPMHIQPDFPATGIYTLQYTDNAGHVQKMLLRRIFSTQILQSFHYDSTAIKTAIGQANASGNIKGDFVLVDQKGTIPDTYTTISIIDQTSIMVWNKRTGIPSGFPSRWREGLGASILSQ